MAKRCAVTNVRAILLVPAALAIVFALLFTSASPAGAHPLEHCSLGWTEVNGVPVEGSPEEPRTICRNDFHRHLWRNIAVSSATFVSLFTLLYALIVTPEALRQEKATRRGRWRLMLRPRQMYRTLPRRYWMAHWCSFLPAYLAGYLLAPAFLEWAFPPVSDVTVTLYVLACGFVAFVGWRIWARKRREGDLTASWHSMS